MSLAWGLLSVWAYPLPSLAEVTSSAHSGPVLDQIIKTPAISQETASLSHVPHFPPLFFKCPSPWAQGLLFCPSRLPAAYHRPGGDVQPCFPSLWEGFIFVQ